MIEYTDAYYLLAGDFGDNKSCLRLFHFPSISSWIVRYYLRDLMKECVDLSLISIDVNNSFVTAKLCKDGVRFYFFRRYRNEKITMTELGNEEYLDKDLCPREFLDLFKEKNEVVIARNCQNTTNVTD